MSAKRSSLEATSFESIPNPASLPTVERELPSAFGLNMSGWRPACTKRVRHGPLPTTTATRCCLSSCPSFPLPHDCRAVGGRALREPAPQLRGHEIERVTRATEDHGRAGLPSGRVSRCRHPTVQRAREGRTAGARPPPVPSRRAGRRQRRVWKKRRTSSLSLPLPSFPLLSLPLSPSPRSLYAARAGEPRRRETPTKGDGAHRAKHMIVKSIFVSTVHPQSTRRESRIVNSTLVL
eukprot:scaffold253626_cov36-Tisochrysis_lutea.AAC.1